jgi:hypothetical protein
METVILDLLMSNILAQNMKHKEFMLKTISQLYLLSF